MRNLRWRSVVLCTAFGLLGTFLIGCDAATAPEVGLRATEDAYLEPCDNDGEAVPCPPQPCYLQNAQATCAPIDTEMCVDPVTGEPVACPPPVERLAFGSGGELESYLAPLYDATDDQLLAAERQRGLTLSLRGYLDNGEGTESGAEYWSFTDGPTGSEAVALENDGVVREDFAVSDAFLSVLNARGELQVGDTIYKVTRDNVYAVTPENLAYLNEVVPTLGSPAPATADPRLTVHPVETTDVQEEEPAPNQTAPEDAPPSSHGPILAIRRGFCHVDFGNRRMHGVSYITSMVIYSEAGVKTEWERRKWWWVGWSNTSQDGALAYDQVSSLRRVNGTPFPQSPQHGSNWGEPKIRKVLASGWFRSIRGL
ncbi:MAG TPA: hypothetical protein VFQ45_09675, partial [Longimicrobium sp.]|nr:hypothetical protein [Longimicrobium sp.]